MKLALMAGATSPALMGFGTMAGVPVQEPVAAEMQAPDIAPLTPEMVEDEQIVEATPSQEAATRIASDVEASYYADRFHGRMTANGETFDMNAMTAAHKTLPFGTMVKVTNVSSGESVVVRINDRGPYHGDRVIDLSKAAASRLGMMGSGTAQVDIDVIA